MTSFIIMPQSNTQLVNYFPFKDPLITSTASDLPTFHFPNHIFTRLEHVSSKPLNFLLAGFAIVTHRFSSAQEIVIGITAENVAVWFTFSESSTVRSAVRQCQDEDQRTAFIRETLSLMFGFDSQEDVSESDLHIAWSSSAENLTCRQPPP